MSLAIWNEWIGPLNLFPHPTPRLFLFVLVWFLSALVLRSRCPQSLSASRMPGGSQEIDSSFTKLALPFYIPFLFLVPFPFPLDGTVLSKLCLFSAAAILKILQNYSILRVRWCERAVTGFSVPLIFFCSFNFLEFPWEREKL